MVGTKTTQASDNNSSLKKVNSIGRNVINKNVEKTFSGENLYHKKKLMILLRIIRIMIRLKIQN